MKAYVIAEHADAARELAAGARTLADEVALIAIGDMEVPEAVADRVLILAVPDGAAYDDADATVIAALDAAPADVVLVEPTRRMLSVAGRVAAHAGVSVVTDVIAFNEDGTATSLHFGGAGMKKSKAPSPAIYTVGSGMFDGSTASGAGEVEELAWVAPAHPVTVTARTPIDKTGVDLTKADIVVAAGRGAASEGAFAATEQLAEKIGAGLGCTRPLTEGDGLMPHDTYIGVSGLMLAPKTYVGVGASGQMQHMVGVNRADVIFAINKDKNAPIFKQCDYGLVGDAEAVLPQLVAAL